MFLSAEEIKDLISQRKIDISPFQESQLKGVSYTFVLGKKLKTLKKKEMIDSRGEVEFDEREMDESGCQLNPGDFAIFYTEEKVDLKGKYVCLLSTRAAIAQMGLDVTQNSFLCEPDTNNQFALETTNRGTIPVRLYPGTKIAKGIFSEIK